MVDRRLLIGIIVVLGVQGLVSFMAGVVKFGAGGTPQDYFFIAFFGILLSVPFVIVAFVIGLGPGVAIWISVMAVCKFAGLSERGSAILSAPIVAMAVSVICVFGMFYTANPKAEINRELVLSVITFSGPAMVAAALYAYLAWPKAAKHKETFR